MKREHAARLSLVTFLFALTLSLGAPAAAGDLPPARRIPGGLYEASGATSAPGGGILFVDDARPDAVFWMELSADGSVAAPPVAVPLGTSVEDPEGITTDGQHVFVVGSQSRGNGRGAGLVRFRFDSASRRALGVESIADLKSLLATRLPVEKGGKKHELNIEGLAWDAKHRRLLLGLRAPLDHGQALVVPLGLRDEGFTRASLEVGAPVPLDLGGLGIRGFEADGERDFFWVIAGGSTDGKEPSRLVQWDGTGSGVRPVATFPDQLKPEGVVRTKVGGKRMTLVLCDTSRYLLIE
jgi:hypothetical protein